MSLLRWLRYAGILGEYETSSFHLQRDQSTLEPEAQRGCIACACCIGVIPIIITVPGKSLQLNSDDILDLGVDIVDAFRQNVN